MSNAPDMTDEELKLGNDAIAQVRVLAAELAAKGFLCGHPRCIVRTMARMILIEEIAQDALEEGAGDETVH